MNKPEARAILDAEIDRFRSMPFPELVTATSGPVYVCERTGASGTPYQIEIEVFWETSHKKRIRIVGSCDESPHKPIFWKIPVLRWIPIYASSVTGTFSRDDKGSDEKRQNKALQAIGAKARLQPER